MLSLDLCDQNNTSKDFVSFIWYFLRNEEQSDECRGKWNLFAAMTPLALVLAVLDLKVRRSATVVVGRSFGLFKDKALYQIFIIY